MTRSENHHQLLAYLKLIYGASERCPELPEKVRRRLISQFQLAMLNQIPPIELFSLPSFKRLADESTQRDVLLSAIWRRELRVDLFHRGGRMAGREHRISSAGATITLDWRPVFVRLANAALAPTVRIKAVRGANPARMISDPGSAGWSVQPEWEVALEIGDYSFETEPLNPGGAGSARVETVMPVFLEVDL